MRDLLFEQKPGFSKKGRNVNILFAKLTFGSAYFFFCSGFFGAFLRVVPGRCLEVMDSPLRSLVFFYCLRLRIRADLNTINHYL